MESITSRSQVAECFSPGFQGRSPWLLLAHDRRRILHFAVPAHPTAEWTAQQMREAFPWDNAPHYLLRDRDRSGNDSFGMRFQGT